MLGKYFQHPQRLNLTHREFTPTIVIIAPIDDALAKYRGDLGWIGIKGLGTEHGTNPIGICFPVQLVRPVRPPSVLRQIQIEWAGT